MVRAKIWKKLVFRTQWWLTSGENCALREWNSAFFPVQKLVEKRQKSLESSSRRIFLKTFNGLKYIIYLLGPYGPRKERLSYVNFCLDFGNGIVLEKGLWRFNWQRNKRNYSGNGRKLNGIFPGFLRDENLGISGFVRDKSPIFHPAKIPEFKPIPEI